MPRVMLSIVLRVYPLAFTSTMLCPMDSVFFGGGRGKGKG